MKTYRLSMLVAEQHKLNAEIIEMDLGEIEARVAARLLKSPLERRAVEPLDWRERSKLQSLQEKYGCGKEVWWTSYSHNGYLKRKSETERHNVKQRVRRFRAKSSGAAAD